ncbi:uncharacterized protein N7487_009400 [Penicillium crustosum]|uniref:uncharacterized protein n=1 Tax=Penicillium crustosum TaxID=36656 RepID=UPI00238CC33E|nr:uncharacterized protein N7487_009400 [Penicillium crustosum]KAJ5395097.1 hypothetical protein N7487_009400 [Penicillium crustosum]
MHTFICIVKQKHQNAKKKQRKKKTRPRRGVPDRRGVGTQRTKDRLIFHNFTFSYRYFIVLESSTRSFCFSF